MLGQTDIALFSRTFSKYAKARSQIHQAHILLLMCIFSFIKARGIHFPGLDYMVTLEISFIKCKRMMMTTASFQSFSSARNACMHFRCNL